MKVLGPCLIPHTEQRQLTEGACLEIPRARILKLLPKAKIGDLMWVQEPWFLIQSRRFGPQNIREVSVGPVLGRKLPAHVRRHLHELRQSSKLAQTLHREDSRATLEIMCIGEHSVRVEVHMRQVDAFRKERA